jgi:hypothetical protein
LLSPLDVRPGRRDAKGLGMNRGTSSVVTTALVAFAMHPALAQPAPPAPPPPSPDPNWAPPPTQPPPEPATPTPVEQPPTTTEAATPSPAPLPAPAPPAEEPAPGSKFSVYGFTMLDIGYDFGHIGNVQWEDTVRPTKLPAFDDENGKGGRTFASVRQTRFGVKATTPTGAGDIKTTFEFELFGTGVDAGQTTFRLRHAVADWKTLRAGQTWSPFMDIDVFPNSIEYWGPNGMAFYRNVQVAWMPIQGDSRVTVALERPGGSPDTGIYSDRLELENVKGRLPAPDLSAEGRYGGAWGYVEAAGILRYIKWDDLDPASPRLDGDAVGWGVNLSSNLKLGPAVLRLSALYGEAIENYMNDAPADIGAVANANPALIDGEALPVLGLVGFVDIEWSKLLTSSAGWSMVWIDNSSGQTPDAFHIGHYALANLLLHPAPEFMMGGELQFGRRENNSDDFTVNDWRVQFSFKYNFEKTFGGK